MMWGKEWLTSSQDKPRIKHVRAKLAKITAVLGKKHVIHSQSTYTNIFIVNTTISTVQCSTVGGNTYKTHLQSSPRKSCLNGLWCGLWQTYKWCIKLQWNLSFSNVKTWSKMILMIVFLLRRSILDCVDSKKSWERWRAKRRTSNPLKYINVLKPDLKSLQALNSLQCNNSGTKKPFRL